MTIGQPPGASPAPPAPATDRGGSTAPAPNSATSTSTSTSTTGAAAATPSVSAAARSSDSSASASAAPNSAASGLRSGLAPADSVASASAALSPALAGSALRIASGLLGWLAFFLFLSHYRPLFGGIGWLPLVVAIVAVALDIGLRFWYQATEMPSIPVWWSGPLHGGGLLVAWIVVLIVIAVFIPSARRELQMRDHAWTQGLQPLRGGIGLAQRQDYYRAETGLTLLSNAPALELRLQALNNAPLEFPPVQWRSDYALIYAALRTQGYSDEKILTMPCGRRILLGTLCAEAVPPYWLPLADTWLFNIMMANPTGGLRLGWLRPGFTRGYIAQLLARPELITAQTAEALLFVSGYIPEVFNEDGTAILLKLKASRALKPAPGQPRPTRDQQLESAYYQELARAREKLATFLGTGRPDGAALLITAHYPQSWDAATREAARSAVGRFIALVGQRAEWIEAADLAQMNKANAAGAGPGPGAASAPDTEGPPGGAHPGARPAPSPADNIPTAEPLKPDVMLHFTLRSSLFDKVRYESASTSSGGGAGESQLIVAQEESPEIAIDEHEEIISVKPKSRSVLRYAHSAALQDGEGPARLPMLMVRLVKDGQELELTLPVYQRLNLDYARTALQAMDATPPLTTTLSTVLNYYTTHTLLAPWRLDQPAIPTAEDWKCAQGDRTPAP